MQHCTAELVAEVEAGLPESPVWEARTQRLLWADVERGLVHSLDPSTGEDAVVHDAGEAMGFVALATRADGEPGYVIGVGLEVRLLDPNWRPRRVLPWPGSTELGHQLNDGQCDAHGNLWAGTQTRPRVEDASALHKLETMAGKPELVRDGVTLSNGIGWSVDGRFVYHVDTTTRRVDRAETGRPGPADFTPYVDFGDLPGVPDGLAVDAVDGLWVACHGAGVVRHVLEGELVGVVEVPAARTTSCTFAGPDLDLLVITAAGAEDGVGTTGIYRCDVGVPGRPAGRFAACFEA